MYIYLWITSFLYKWCHVKEHDLVVMTIKWEEYFLLLPSVFPRICSVSLEFWLFPAYVSFCFWFLLSWFYFILYLPFYSALVSLHFFHFLISLTSAQHRCDSPTVPSFSPSVYFFFFWLVVKLNRAVTDLTLGIITSFLESLNLIKMSIFPITAKYCYGRVAYILKSEYTC